MRQCSVDGCEGKHDSNGLCHKHAERMSELEGRDWHKAYMEIHKERDTAIAENKILREALEIIMDDTEDKEAPYRSLGASGPVKDIARKAIKEVSHEKDSD